MSENESNQKVEKWASVIPCLKEGYAVFKDENVPGGFSVSPILAFALINDGRLGSFLSPIVGDSDVGCDEDPMTSTNFSHYHWGKLSDVKI